MPSVRLYLRCSGRSNPKASSPVPTLTDYYSWSRLDHRGSWQGCERSRKCCSMMGNLNDRKEQLVPRSPWIAGSFYLAGIVIVGTLFLVMARTVDVLILPIVLVASMLGVSIVGAFQLRNDNRLSEKNFLQLMALTFKYLPLLRRRDEPR